MFHRKATSSPELPAADKVVSTMSDLINGGNPKAAADLAAVIAERPGLYDKCPEYAAINTNAHFHFRASLASRLIGRDDEANWYRAWARERCPNYKPSMEVDFMRDEVLALIRRGRPLRPWRRKPWSRDIQKSIKDMEAMAPVSDDPNRYGATLMTEGRLMYALGNYRDAFGLCMNGRDMMADEQWRRNATFFMMRAAAHFDGGKAFDFAGHVLDDDPSPQRQQLARLILRRSAASRLVIVLYDIAERAKVRLNRIHG